jgi:rod shape-determining protein MreC
MTVWYRESDAGPLHRTRDALRAVTAPVGAAGELITRPVRGIFIWAADLGVSRTELVTLRKQNETLRQRNAQLEEAALENERLRGLVDLVQAGKVKAIAARVIGRPSNSWEGVIYIDKGSKDGLTVGMPVLGRAGLLGQTVDVTGHTAQVRLITDQRSGVAAMLQRTRATGIAKGSIEGRISLEFVSKETTIRPGDVVITSGLGGVYPKGLIVGDVTEVLRRPSDLYPFIRVEPTAKLAGIEEVLVLTGGVRAPELGGGE